MMGKSTDRQWQKAEGAMERAIATFMRAIDRIEEQGDRDGFAFQLIEEVMLLKLCDELIKRIDARKERIPDAMLKLSNALADYRDSLFEER